MIEPGMTDAEIKREFCDSLNQYPIGYAEGVEYADSHPNNLSYPDNYDTVEKLVKALNHHPPGVVSDSIAYCVGKLIVRRQQEQQ